MAAGSISSYPYLLSSSNSSNKHTSWYLILGKGRFVLINKQVRPLKTILTLNQTLSLKDRGKGNNHILSVLHIVIHFFLLNFLLKKMGAGIIHTPCF